MHGSSSVPTEEVQRINAAGGKLDPTARGVNENEYLPAAKLGVTKINIDTDGRLVWTRVHREFFRDHPSEFDFRPPGKTFVQEYAKFIAQKNEKLGSAPRLHRRKRARGRLNRSKFKLRTYSPGQQLGSRDQSVPIKQSTSESFR